MIETAASRARMLDDAILSHGKEKMDPGQLGTWNDIVMQASLIPFNEVFAQFDPASQSFYIAYNFNSGQRLETTTYSDEDDTDVYFTVRSKDKVIFQNVLPRVEFFERASSTWRMFAENDV